MTARDEAPATTKGMAVTGNEVARAGDAHDEAHAHDAHEEVTSPDQHRRTISPRLAGLGAVITIIALPLMAFFGNHEGGVEKIFLVGIAGLILLILVLDIILRKSGLKS
jgi:Protein of unknown function (DUF2631)